MHFLHPRDALQHDFEYLKLMDIERGSALPESLLHGGPKDIYCSVCGRAPMAAPERQVEHGSICLGAGEVSLLCASSRLSLQESDHILGMDAHWPFALCKILASSVIAYKNSK